MYDSLYWKNETFSIPVKAAGIPREGREKCTPTK